MLKESYFEIKKLSGKKKIAAAEKILDDVRNFFEELSTEDIFWFFLIQNEIEISKRNFENSEKILEEACLLSKTIQLTKANISSLNGKIAYTKDKLSKYEEAISFFQKALSLTEDTPRRNYYYSKLIHCFFRLNNNLMFVKTLTILVDEILRSNILKYFNSITDTIWELSQYAKEEKGYYQLESVLSRFQEKQDLDSQQHALLEFWGARLARHQLNRERFLNLMERSLGFCKHISTDFFISMSFNFITMLENPFGDNYRAIILLEECLPLTENKSLRIHTLNKLGSNLRFIGNYEKAIEYLEEALEINESQNPWQESFSHNTLGMIYTTFGDRISTKKALEHYDQSLAISKKNDDPYGLGYTYGALGWLESNQGDFLEAKKWYELSISIFKENSLNIPPIILLSLSELLSKDYEKNEEKISNLVAEAQKQIWTTQRKLDIGRYYNTLGNIAINRRRLSQAELEFSNALDYGDYFEVESQSLLGLTKVNLELFINTDNKNYLHKAKLFLNDLKDASKTSFLIQGEVDLILGLIEMYNRNYSVAEEKFNQIIKLAKHYNYLLLESKCVKQKETLQILIRHQKLEKIATSSKNNSLKTNQIKDAIDYLNELSRILGSQDSKK